MVSHLITSEETGIRKIEQEKHAQGKQDNGRRSDVKWLRCQGCKGEIGIPFAMREKLVKCPGCGLPVNLSETILFRPAAPAVPSPSAPSAPAHQLNAQHQPARPSIELLRSADKVFNWGIACIVLGWTILVPFIAYCSYYNISQDARKENALVPGKATIGLVLSLLFGVAQGAAMIAKVNH